MTDAMPQTMPNIVRKLRILCARSVARVCLTISNKFIRGRILITSSDTWIDEGRFPFVIRNLGRKRDQNGTNSGGLRSRQKRIKGSGANGISENESLSGPQELVSGALAKVLPRSCRDLRPTGARFRRNKVGKRRGTILRRRNGAGLGSFHLGHDCVEIGTCNGGDGLGPGWIGHETR